MIRFDASLLPRTRAEARARGIAHYYPLTPCKWGHISVRAVRSGACLECERARVAMNRREASLIDPRAAWAARAVSNAAWRARHYNLPFNLTAVYLRSIAPDVCPALGRLLLYDGRGHHPDMASLDRLLPELGYVVGNVAVISLRANTIKANATPREILDVAYWAERQTNEHPLLAT